MNNIILDGSAKALVPCRNCGCKVASATKHHFHPYRLDCAECGRFHAWLGRFDAMRLGMEVEPDVVLFE
jgi:hypothetical protein